MTSENSDGSEVSTTSTSLENLDSMRPSGVTSKNCNGAFNTFPNNSSCSIRAARHPAKNGIKSAKIDAMAATTSTDYIKRIPGGTLHNEYIIYYRLYSDGECRLT